MGVLRLLAMVAKQAAVAKRSLISPIHQDGSHCPDLPEAQIIFPKVKRAA